MFDNIGGKIMVLAKVICWVGIIASILSAIGVTSSSKDEVVGFITFVLIAGLGSLFSWISSFFMYGFGKLIEKATSIDAKLEGIFSTTTSINSKSHFQLERVVSIDKKLNDK